MHVFWGKKKLVQLKIVYHKVSSMLYSVQNLKIRAVEGQYFIIGESCISHSILRCTNLCSEDLQMHEFLCISKIRASEGSYYINSCISKFFEPNSKSCIVKVRAA